jgi:hypothetical protein
MHSIAIFFGFLIGTYGLACCVGLVVAFWVSRSDGNPDVVRYAWWVRPMMAAAMLPVPLMLTIGGGAALRWGFVGQ